MPTSATCRSSKIPRRDNDGLTGLITAEMIEKQLGDVGGKTFFLCGPQGMYDFCVPEIRKLGVPMRKIRKETYGPPLAVWKSAGWPEDIEPGRTFEVTVSGKGTIRAEAGTPLLVSLEKAGIVRPGPLPVGGMQHVPREARHGTSLSTRRGAPSKIGPAVRLHPYVRFVPVGKSHHPAVE